MEWNKENTTLLIKHFKEKRELWDSTNEHFKDRNKKHDAWMDLASKFDAEKSVVEKKMRSLIGQFQRELRKPRSGAGAEEISSKWFAFELLLFLRDKNKVRSTNEAGVSEIRQISAVFTIQPDVRPAKDIHDARCKTTVNRLDDNSHENRTSPKRKKKRTFDSLIAQKEAFDSLEAQEEAYGIMNKLQTERKTRDNFSVFGEYIACRLRNLQDPFTISTVENQIHNIIFQAEMNLYSGGANRIGSYSGSANTIGSNSGSASTSFNRGYYTSSFLNNSSGLADLPHTDTDSSHFSEDFGSEHSETRRDRRRVWPGTPRGAARRRFKHRRVSVCSDHGVEKIEEVIL